MTDAPSKNEKESNSDDARKIAEQREQARRLEAMRKRQEEQAAAKMLLEQNNSTNKTSMSSENERKQLDGKKFLHKVEIVDSTREENKLNEKTATTKVEAIPSKLTAEALTKTVNEIHDATFATTIGVSSPESKKLQTILATSNEADRKAIEAEYEKQFPGHSLRDDLKTQMGAESTNYARMEALLQRKDGQADEVGQIQVALTRLNNVEGDSIVDRTVNGQVDKLSKITFGTIKSPIEAEKQSAENDIMKTLASLDSAGIEKLMQQNRELNSNQDLRLAMLNNPNLSPECKQAITILLKGNNRTTQDTLDLAQVAVDFKRPDIFNIAFQNASPEARQQFKNNDGANRIDTAFEDGFDKKAANDYLELGHLKFSTLVEGNTHWYHTNQDSITTSVKNASEQERGLYANGQKLATSNVDNSALNDSDRKALEFYSRAHQALMDARNSDREVVLWESQLLGRTTLEQDMLKTHSDGFLTTFNWNLGSGHKRDDFFKQVENMNADDWKKLQSPEEREKLDQSLQVIATEAERKQVMQMITEKTSAATYEQSKTLGRRGIEQILADGGDKIDAIANMTVKEKEEYKANEEFRNRIDNEVKYGLSSIHKKEVAEYLLRNLDAPDAVKQVMVDSTKVPLEDPSQTVRKMEEAFKNDPTLLQRIKDTEAALKANKSLGNIDGRNDDVILTRSFEAAVDAIARTADPTQPMVTVSEAEPNIAAVVRPANHDDFQKSLWETGRLDLQHRLQLDKFSKDPLAKYKDLAAATEEERQQVYKSVPGPANNFLQITDEEKKLVALGAQQNSFTKVDEYQAGLISPTRTEAERKVDFEKLTSDLEKMTPAQKQDLANEYFTKTGKLFSVAAIENAPEQAKWRLRELLAPTDINVRQVVLDARTERSEHSSVIDNILDSHWDASRIAAEECTDKLNKFVIEHKTELDALDPDARRKFDDAVANYKKAENEYVDSKGKLAETFVDATITIAAIGGAVFTGGTSLTLLQAIGVGAAGAAYRTAAMKVIQGSDFDASPENIARQSFKGSTSALLGFLGPEQIGMKGFVKVGEQTATRVAENTLTRVTEVGLEKTAFKEGVDVTKAITTSVSDLKRQMAIMGTKDSEKAIQSVVDKVMNTSATQGEKEIFATALRNELKNQTVKSIRDKVIAEAESATISAITGAGSNAGTEILSTVVGLDDPKTLFERMANGAVSGAGGALVFHGAFRVVRGVATPFFVGKDETGLFAGDNTIVRLANGEIKPIKPGEKYYFQQGDSLVVPREAIDAAYSQVQTENTNSNRIKTNSEKIVESIKEEKNIEGAQTLTSGIENSSVGGRTEVTDGQITKMVTPDGKEYRYSYTNGELTNVEMPANNNPSVTVTLRKNGDSWEYYESKVDRYYPLNQEVLVDKHGNLTTKSGDGTVVFEGDGTVNKFSSTGRLLSVEGANVEQQSERLMSLIDTKLAGDLQMQKRMHNWMELLHGREFQLRDANNSRLTEAEIALTFKEVSRLLSSDSANGIVPPAMRSKLAEQILFHAAHPSLIEQGQYPTCNTATIENRDFTRKPSDMAKMIVDVALTGKYESKDGTIDMSHFKIDANSEVFNATQKHGPDTTSGIRSLASQIAQETTINAYWQNQTMAPNGTTVERGALVYKKLYDANLLTEDSGMRLVNSKTNEIYNDKQDGPGLGLEQIEEAQRQIGKHDSIDDSANIGWYEGESVKIGGVNYKIDSAENLKRALFESAKTRTVADYIMVNHTHPLIGGKGSVFSDIPANGAAHVVTIRKINDDGTIELVNQWKRSSDRILDKSATADDVFQSMQLHPSQKLIPLVNNQFSSSQFLDIPALSY